jgi:hypothetical protein
VNTHCPDCGFQLEEPSDLKRHWLRLLKCKRCVEGWFLEVADPQWIYPMQRLDPGVGRRINDADESKIEEAASRIMRIDYKTVSIIGFERTLMGSFDPTSTYKIVYPDGSQT